MSFAKSLAGVLLAAVAVPTPAAFGVEPSNKEQAAAHAWTEAKLTAAASTAPAATSPARAGPVGTGPFFSFSYGGRKWAEALPSWEVQRASRQTNQGCTEHSVTYRDKSTGLAVRWVATDYRDAPAVEWVLYFKNEGQADTPILEDIRPLDCGFGLPRDKSARVHHASGSECRLDDFAPRLASLGPTDEDPYSAWVGQGNPFRMESKGGRSSCGALPFFNLDMGTHGVIGAIGWTGDWAAAFWRTDAEVRVQAGMKRTHLKLLPGEEIRTPRILLLFWEGDRLRGHNLLRRFILDHHTPTVNGRRAQAPICHATWGANFVDTHIAHGKWWKDQGLPLDYLWVDAGWFGKDEVKRNATVFNSQWWRFVGDWQPNPGYFPQGLKPLGEALRSMGLGFLLWVEPERVFKETAWTREHPEFLLGPIGDNYLLNLGDPRARRMLTDYLADLITTGNIGCYRQDFNTDPRQFWDAADAPDRIGITEIRHITGLYAMWDELRDRFPGLLIDNCSSGGRRIDLETVSRSIPLWRSDAQCAPGFKTTAMQGQTHGLGLWVPLSTGVCDRQDGYAFRSALGPGMILIMYEFENDLAKHFSVDWLRKSLAELTSVREYFVGDFYPLLSYSLSEEGWAVWQFDRPDLGKGMVLALRRGRSPFTTMTAQLQALAADAQYEFRDLDTNEVQRRSGRQWAESGLHIQIDTSSGSKLYTYNRR